MTITEDGRKALTYRQEVRRWLRDEMADEEVWILPEVTDNAVEHFIVNQDFVRAAMYEFLRPVIYDLGQRILSATRRDGAVLLGDEIVTRTEMKRRSKPLSDRFAAWMEHSGDRYIKFPLMTREQVFQSADERERRVRTETRIIRFERAVAGALEPGQQVRDVFTAEQLEDLWKQICRVMKDEEEED